MSGGITFAEAGTGEGLLCLHGIGAGAESFHHQMGAFDGSRVVAWNMPGYGGSTVEQSPPNFGHLTARLRRLVANLGGPVHLLGHSIGGMVALDYVLTFPGDVRSLTLVATTPRFGGRDPSFAKGFLRARLGPLDDGMTMAQMAKAAAPRLVGPDTPHAETERIAQAMAAVPEATWRDILRCLVTFDRAADLGAVPCPALVVAGDADPNAPAATMKKMAARIAGAQFHILDGCGHFPHHERPDAFNQILADCLDRTR